MGSKQKKSASNENATETARPVSRRRFLQAAGTIATATTAAAAVGFEPLVRSGNAEAATRIKIAKRRPSIPTVEPEQGTFAPLDQAALRARRRRAYRLREERAHHWLEAPFKTPLANDDEILYPDGWANFSKSLPHDELGHPDPDAYRALVDACTSGRVEDFAAIPLGGEQKLRNPQGGLSLEFCGYDSNQTIVPPAPSFATAWRAGEMVEIYWASLLRDIPFLHYDTDPAIAEACADLSKLSAYRGPKQGGAVTPQTIFRGPYEGCTVGPFVSQFLLHNLAFGAQINTQRVRTFVPGIDYMTDYDEWLARQNGAPFGPRAYDANFYYLRNIRDLAAWVDADPPLQAGYHALSVLLQIGAPLNPESPYVDLITNQDAFTTFGPVEWFDLVGRAARPAHEAGWFQKWRIHRSLRPEEFAGRVHNHLVGAFDYPLHPDVLNTEALAKTFSLYGTYLCAQAYPDGAPTHCAYPSGHSVGSGSTVTMLKALFDLDFEFPNPVEPSPSGIGLQTYSGPPLTVGGELNKLAFNIGMARVTAGIHWRSDVVQGNALGEATSIAILEDMAHAYNEPFGGFTIEKFDGTSVTT